jgi:hypothetical protein
MRRDPGNQGDLDQVPNSSRGQNKVREDEPVKIMEK